MSRRVLDVAIRSEFRKGFGDIARQFASLEKSLQKVDGLTRSLNKVAENLDRTLAFKQAQYGAKKVAEAQNTANKSLNEGVKIAKRYESAHTALGNKLVAVATAQKAGSISNKQRLEAEIGLLSQYVKKTGDLSVLQAKNNKFRDNRGRFVNFTKDSLQAVSNSLARSVETGLKAGTTKGVDSLVTQMKATSSRIRSAVAGITASAYQPSFTNRNAQAGFYDAVWGSGGRRSGAGLGTQEVINRTVGVRDANANTGLMLGGDERFNRLKLQYQQLEQKAASSQSRIRRMNFGPNPQNSEAGFKKLFDSYNRLGHFLFQLQYSTLTIFGLSGIGMILNQADAYITLRNQVARTSESINDLGANMADVFRISKETFADPKTVGKIFSTLNKYSEDLNLSRQQVGNVTGAITGAFAASPGNAAEKAASQYQFVQAIQSNRLGGDELRSIMEMAPYVQDILAKGIGKLRGMDGPADMRALASKPGTAVTAREIVAVFNNPETQREIKETLGNQARTFGDMLMVGKVRLMEMTEQFSNSTGIFTQLVNGISRFIMDDSKWNKFTQAVEAATAALVIYAGMLGMQAAGKGLGKIGQMGGGLLAPSGAFGARNMVLARRSVDNGIGLAGSLVNGAKQAPGAIANGVSAALGTMGNATKTFANGVKNSGNLLTVAGRGVTGMFTNLGRSLRSLFSMNTLTGIFRGLGTAMKTAAVAVNFLLRGVFGLSIPLIAVAAIIAALVMRFNTLLGAMTGGMNIIDILRGTWNMLMDSLKSVASFLANSFLGDIWRAITGFVDGILRFVGRKAAENHYFQEEQANRQYGGVDGRAVMHKDGKNYYVRVDNGQFYSTGEEARNADGSWRQADFNAGDRNVRRYQPNLPSGQQSTLPNPVGTGAGNQGRVDPWPEYIRDLRLKIQAVSDLRDVLPQFQETQGQINENIRRAMDVMNFDSSGYTTLADAWTAFSAANGEKAAKVNELNAQLKSERLVESLREFLESLGDLYTEFNTEVVKSGLSGREGTILENRIALINRFLEDQNFTGGMDGRAAVRDALSAGNFANAETALRDNLNEFGRSKFDSVRADQEDAENQKVIRSMQRTNSLGREALENQARALGLYGNQRDLQIEINSAIEQFVDQNGHAALQNEQLNAALREQIALIVERNAQQQAYNADWRNGIGDAFAEYSQGLDDLAGATKNVFGNALKGIEDSFVSLITTGKANLSELMTSLQADIARIFVQQLIMKPITNWIKGIGEKLFGLTDEDKVINAQNVYINGANLGDMMGGQAGGSLGNIFGKIMPPKGGAGGIGSIMSMVSNFLPPPFNFLSSIFSLFHGGGTVGNSTLSRVVNPSVFANAKRYHTGTLNAGLPALGVNEVPAILQRGEKVLTASQYSAMNSGNNSTTFAPNITVAYTSNGGGSGGEGQGGEDHAKAVAAMVRGAVNEAILEYDQKSRRPGSPAYLQNKKR